MFVQTKTDAERVKCVAESAKKQSGKATQTKSKKCKNMTKTQNCLCLAKKKIKIILI